MLHRKARSYHQAIRSREPWHDSGHGAHTVRMAKFEYADDAALIDEDAGQATAWVTSLAAVSIADAAMIISTKKSNVMHIHKTTRTSATTEADVAKLNLVHKCESCSRQFTKQSGLKIHMVHWCERGRAQRSHIGSVTDKAVKTSKRRAAEASLDKVTIGSDPPLENGPISNIWDAGGKATGATRLMCIIAWRWRSRRLAH